MRTQLTPKEKGAHLAPQFSAHVYCGQTAEWMGGWITMPLDTEVCLSQGDIVLYGDRDPLPTKGHTPNFRPMSIVAKRSPVSATAELL